MSEWLPGDKKHTKLDDDMENPVDAKRRKQSARLLQTYHLPACGLEAIDCDDVWRDT